MFGTVTRLALAAVTAGSVLTGFVPVTGLSLATAAFASPDKGHDSGNDGSKDRGQDSPDRGNDSPDHGGDN